jgi:rare lipoprotein A
MRYFVLMGACALLAACASAPKPTPSTPKPTAPGSSSAPRPVATPEVRKDHVVCVPSREHDLKDYRGGGLYAPAVSDSAPPTPVDVSGVPEPTPRDEPRSRVGNKSPYAVLGKRYYVLPTAAGYRERGTASWYGYKFHGRSTSNMEIYDMCAFSAAHKSLPLPSYVRVTNTDNGRSVIVRVNDRGPFHAGRVIDLSYAAAARLDMTRRGTANVEIVAISSEAASAAAPTPTAPASVNATPIVSTPVMPAPPTTTSNESTIATTPSMPAPPSTSGVRVQDRWLQLGSFSDKNNADRLLQRLLSANLNSASIEPVDMNGATRYRVRIGPLNQEQEQQTREQLNQLGVAVPR